MAKTRRVKLNTQPKTLFGNHVKPVVLQPGARDSIKGVRIRPDESGKVPPTMRTNGKPGRPARETTVGMVATGINKGKRYPERSKKRGGVVPEKLSLVQRAGRKMRKVIVGDMAAE